MTADVACPDQSPGAEPSVDPRRVPAGTTTLFVLLVAAVLATTGIVYTTLYGAVPSTTREFFEAIDTCQAREPALGDGDLVRRANALQRVQQCMAPVYQKEAAWAAVGVVLVFGLAGLLYWTRPRRLIRRRQLTPVREEDDPSLSADLVELVKKAGLTSTPPMFLIAPNTDDVNAEAFGRFGRRYVQLNAPLVELRVAEKDRFRATVLHELAHLRNRDVDKGELTYAISSSFVALALMPLVLLLAFRPAALSQFTSAGPVWTAVALLVLTSVVVLTRLALRRVRELHADARAATVDPDALRRSVEQLPPGRWRPPAFRPHPDKQERLVAIEEPRDVLLRSRPWELFGASLVTAVLGTNLSFVLRSLWPDQSTLSTAIAALVCVAGLVGLLGVAIWRVVVHAPKHHPPLRAVVLPPVIVAAGWLCGEPIALISVQTSHGIPVLPVEYGQIAVAAVVLVTGGVVVAVWMASVMRAVLTSVRERRWALPVVVAAGAVIAAPWFVALEEHRDAGLLLTGQWGDDPDTGAQIGWYTALARWTGVDYLPLGHVIYNPLTLTALALLWLVPIMLTRSGRSARAVGPSSVNLRPALIAGLVGGAVHLVACTAIGFVLKATLPIEVRDSNSFVWVVFTTWWAIAILTQVTVAGFVAASTQRHRAVLIPLAVMVTGSLAIAAINLIVLPIARCADVWGSAERIGASCLTPSFTPSFDAMAVHWIMVKAAVVALPAALLGAAVAVLRVRRSRRPSAPPAESEPPAPKTLRLSTRIALAVMITATTAASALHVPASYSTWVAITQPRPADDSSPTGSCVIGTWTETSHDSMERTDGTLVHWTGKGRVQRFLSDGTGSIEFGTAAVETATVHDDNRERVTSGTITFTYEIRDEKIHFSNIVANGTATEKVDGATPRQQPLRTSTLEPTKYQCRSNNTMGQATESTLIELERTPAAPDTPMPSQSADSCLVGTWTEISHNVYIGGEWWTGKGRVQRFLPDGTGRIDDGTGFVITTERNSATWEFVTTGTITFTYQTDNGRILYSNVSAHDGTITLKADGVVKDTNARTTDSLTPDSYTCQGNTMTQTGTDYTIQLSRS